MPIMPQITPSMLLQTLNPSAASTAFPARSATAFQAALDKNSVGMPDAEIRDAGMPGRNTVATHELTTPRTMDMAAGNDGDAILSGLEHLRSVFNTQQSNLANLMSGSAVDTNTMLAVQMEMTNYSMLIDMTSKLASKSAQALDTLMKGQ